MNWEPQDVVAVILASGIALAALSPAISSIILREPITDARSESLSRIMIALIAVLAGYMGWKAGAQ